MMRALFLLLLALPAVAQPSFKGRDLYSWKRDGHWNFALLMGTNRNKTWAEIEKAGLGAGEIVFWLHHCDGGTGHLSYPPAEIKARIVRACEERKIELASPP